MFARAHLQEWIDIQIRRAKNYLSSAEFQELSTLCSYGDSHSNILFFQSISLPLTQNLPKTNVKIHKNSTHRKLYLWINYIFLPFLLSFTLFRRCRERKWRDKAPANIVHTLSDARARERVSLQSLLDSPTKNRDCSCIVFDWTTN